MRRWLGAARQARAEVIDGEAELHAALLQGDREFRLSSYAAALADRHDLAVPAAARVWARLLLKLQAISIEELQERPEHKSQSIVPPQRHRDAVIRVDLVVRLHGLAIPANLPLAEGPEELHDAVALAFSERARSSAGA
jgi:hypothetical protein